MKPTLIISLFFIFSIPSLGQEASLEKALDEFLFGSSIQDSLLESITINDMDFNDILHTMYNYRFIYVRSEFESRTFFSGQDLGIDQYNIASQVYFQGPKGLNIGLVGIMYSKFVPQYNTTILSIGYNKSISGIKGLNIRASYSRYFFPIIDSVKSSAYNSSANIGTTYQWKCLGSSADFSLLLGNKKSAQLNWDLFADIPLVKFGLSNKISIEPEVSFYLGNETVVGNQYITASKSSGEISTQKENFDLMNTIIRVPVSLSIGNIDIIAGYNFNLPGSTNINKTPVQKSFFNLSLGYIFVF